MTSYCQNRKINMKRANKEKIFVNFIYSAKVLFILRKFCQARYVSAENKQDF